MYANDYADINKGDYGTDVKVDGSNANYDSLMKACDVMDEINKVRESYGLQDLKVDPYTFIKQTA